MRHLRLPEQRGRALILKVKHQGVSGRKVNLALLLWSLSTSTGAGPTRLLLPLHACPLGYVRPAQGVYSG